MSDIKSAIEELLFHRNSCYVVQITDKVCNIAISALERQLEPENLGFTEDVIENYKIFEDELIAKGFTFNSLIEAKEKQIPKKPIRVSNNRTDGCPECKTEYYEKFKYCPECGVKLDWSVGE